MDTCIIQAANPITRTFHHSEKTNCKLSPIPNPPYEANSQCRVLVSFNLSHKADRNSLLEACMVTQCYSFYATLCFFKLLIVLLQSMGKNCAQREEQSLLAANTRAPAHVTLCWLCCQRHGRWMDAHGQEEEEREREEE